MSPSRRVLIVDDNEDGAEMLAALLADRGHVTRVAHDGRHALEIAATFHPDVAFLDLGLPGMDGCELAAQLRADPRHAALYLVAVTGYGEASDRRRTHEAGFELHLVKPINLAAIEAALAAIPV
jgi:CheY-like chemotaxis protein